MIILTFGVFKMISKTELENGLAHCIGTEGYKYNAQFGKNFVYTDGMDFLFKAAECYWLMQAIFSHKRTEDFQVWNLKRVEGNKFVLTMREDDGLPNIVEQEIPFSDFPLDEIEFYAVNDHNCGGVWGDVHVVLMLKSEN
jgi:hypothetical protein